VVVWGVLGNVMWADRRNDGPAELQRRGSAPLSAS